MPEQLSPLRTMPVSFREGAGRPLLRFPRMQTENQAAGNCVAVNSAAALIPIQREQGEDRRVNQ